jgi:hypothetical protein
MHVEAGSPSLSPSGTASTSMNSRFRGNDDRKLGTGHKKPTG